MKTDIARFKAKVRGLAKREASKLDDYCEEHSQQLTLPIHMGHSGTASIRQTHNEFEAIVDEAVDHAASRSEMDEVAIRKEVERVLEEVFQETYIDPVDKRACQECYFDREKSDTDVGIRMDVPDEFDDIDAQ